MISMVKYEKYIKQSHTYKLLAQNIANKRLGHACLIVSRDSVLCSSLITLSLLKMFCQSGDDEPCHGCPQCQKVLFHTHPDITNLKGKISVDEMGNIIRESTVKPFEGGYKAYVFENADMMLPAAQNKFLKTLEEPASDVVFFLAAESKEGMLQTILSRAQVYEPQGFSVETLEQALAEEYPDHDGQIIRLAAAMSEGSFFAAERILTDAAFGDIYNDVFDILLNMKKSSQILQYAQKLEKHKEALSDVISVFTNAVRDILMVKSGSSSYVLCKDRINDIITIADEFSQKACVRIIDSLAHSRKRLAYNGNPISVIDEMLFSFLEVKALCL